MVGSNGNHDYRRSIDEMAYAFDSSSEIDAAEMTAEERAAVIALGNGFAEQAGGGVWLLIRSRFTSANGEKGTETRVKDMLRHAFGYPAATRDDLTLNVLLDSPGGNLDSAYTTMLYLNEYAAKVNIYVPARAKSASTLLAVGADQVFLSAFGELGPLDTQIADPRNPANTVSALDCYQSVDYVRDFGFRTITTVLPQLIEATERRIAVDELLGVASTFALGAISPMLHSVTALDFGGWGRSLRIGELYARKLLLAKTKDNDSARIDRIAFRLVYGYTHHLFPIDYHEAQRIGLGVARMEKELYEPAIAVVEACHRKDFVGFLSKEQSDLETSADAEPAAHPPADGGDQETDEHPKADAGIPRAWVGRPADASKTSR